MADKHHVRFYPVGNGDTCQIVLANGRRVLFDFCHRAKAEEDSTPEIDLKGKLKAELLDAGRDDFDVVAFTHADKDHIAGSTEFFHLEYAACYQGNGRIKIKELWVPAAMLLEEVEQGEGREEFAIWKKEARHRLLEGKCIRVFSQPPELMDWLGPELESRGESRSARDHLFVDAGTIVPGFNLVNDKVEFFCHSPFKEHCEDGDIVRNKASLIFNVRMEIAGCRFDFLQVGDCEWEDLEKIVDITSYHGNDDRLDWDLFNIPHHCSYLALSDDKGDSETEPKPKVKKLLLRGREDSYIICSSCPIPDVSESYEQVQPPHIQARKAYKTYLNQVRGRNVLVTMEEPNTSRPEPMVFEITSSGISWARSVMGGAPAIITSTPHRAGYRAG